MDSPPRFLSLSRSKLCFINKGCFYQILEVYCLPTLILFGNEFSSTTFSWVYQQRFGTGWKKTGSQLPFYSVAPNFIFDSSISQMTSFYFLTSHFLSLGDISCIQCPYTVTFPNSLSNPLYIVFLLASNEVCHQYFLYFLDLQGGDVVTKMLQI